eukprot:SRR837773.18099.p2 GENE.SRR837773.18099~~SRR837773.18099.p2  ORF type:complete len:314 (-),score=129.97 SRR837773.18099:159-1100(-)
MRSKLRKDAQVSGRKGLRAKMVHEITSEAENDILALAISFNVVQALRFAITGKLPNEEGMAEGLVNQRMHYILLFSCGLAFIVASIVLAGVIKRLEAAEEAHREHAKAHGQEGPAEDETPFVVRVSDILMNAFAMCSAWCTLFGARVVWDLSPRMPVTVTSIDGRILLATILSVFGFIVVYYLDKVADSLGQNGSMKAAESAIASVVGAVSVLVGFTWECSFDGAVAAVASLNEEHAQSTKFFLGLVVFFGLLVPWRRYILKRSLQLEELYKNRLQAGEGSEKEHAAAGHHHEQSKPLLEAPPSQRASSCLCP